MEKIRLGKDYFDLTYGLYLLYILYRAKFEALPCLNYRATLFIFEFRT